LVERTDSVIRIFAPGDLVAVQRLIGHTIDSSYRGVYPERAIRFFRQFHSAEAILARHRDGTMLVVERRGEVVGTGALVEREITGVFVRPDLQGQGIGWRVMDRLEAVASAAGHRSVSLSVSLPSRAFYERRGYEVLEALSVDVGAGETLDYWEARKSLGPAVGGDGHGGAATMSGSRDGRGGAC
jgi:GNAT superfamily N-acetyltransferase